MRDSIRHFFRWRWRALAGSAIRRGRTDRAGSGASAQEQAEAIVETFAEGNDALASKADLQSAVAHLQSAIDKLEARLTVRIITAQIATATLLFLLLKFFG